MDVMILCKPATTQSSACTSRLYLGIEYIQKANNVVPLSIEADIKLHTHPNDPKNSHNPTLCHVEWVVVNDVDWILVVFLFQGNSALIKGGCGAGRAWNSRHLIRTRRDIHGLMHGRCFDERKSQCWHSNVVVEFGSSYPWTWLPELLLTTSRITKERARLVDTDTLPVWSRLIMSLKGSRANRASGE